MDDPTQHPGRIAGKEADETRNPLSGGGRGGADGRRAGRGGNALEPASRRRDERGHQPGASGGPFDYAHAVADVVFSTDVVIDTIETLNFNDGGYVFATSVDAVVTVFDSDPSRSTSDPATGGDLGQLTTAALARSGGDVTLTASGLGIALSAGTCWIGLTPILDWESGSARLNA